MMAAMSCRLHDWLKALLRQRIDSFGQGKIKIGQTAFAVGRKNETHLVIANVNVGMVFLFVRHFRDRIHKIDGVGEIIKLKGALDMFFLQLPFRDLLQAIFQLIGFDQVGHNGKRVTPEICFANGDSDRSKRHSVDIKSEESSAGFWLNRIPRWRFAGQSVKTNASLRSPRAQLAWRIADRTQIGIRFAQVGVPLRRCLP